MCFVVVLAGLTTFLNGKSVLELKLGIHDEFFQISFFPITKLSLEIIDNFPT